MWSFVNPLFLWAAAATTIPLLLHLLQKRRIVHVPFSTLRFLKLAKQRSASRARLENLLLWLLRTLLLLLLALAFAMPVVRNTAFGSRLGTAPRDVAIVWDVSYSMGYESGRQNVWDTAKATIRSIINGLKAGDRVCIFLADQDVQPLLEQPTSDFNLALSLVKAQAIQNRSSRLRPAVVAAAKALRDSGGREKELFVITDGQALPWTDFNSLTPAEFDKRIACFTALLGAESPQNVAPISVNVEPAVLITGMNARVTVQLTHTGADRDSAVALLVDDKEISRRTTKFSGAPQTELTFNVPPLPAGIHPARFETPADGLLLDNAFYFLLRVKEQLPALCVGSENDTFYLMHALNPGNDTSAIGARRVDPDALANEDLTSAACVFLCNAVPLPGPAMLNLERYVQNGGALVIFPGDRATAADYANWTLLPVKPTAISDVEPERRPLRLLKPRDPVFQGFHLPPGTVPAVTIRQQLTLPPDAKPDVLLSAGEEQPFLLNGQAGKGRVMLFTVSADRQWSDWPLSPFFLPVVHQIVYFAAGVGREPAFQWVTDEQPTPGIQKLAGGNLIAVNVPRDESVLTPITPDQVRAKMGLQNLQIARDQPELLHEIEQHRVGRPLDETLLWIVLALAALELFLANRACRQVAKKSPKPATTVSEAANAPAS